MTYLKCIKIIKTDKISIDSGVHDDAMMHAAHDWQVEGWNESVRM